MKKSLKSFSAGTIAVFLTLGLTACGPSAEEQVAAKVKTICTEANAAMDTIASGELFPEPLGDWTQVQTTFGDLKDKLNDLSTRTSELGETDLARDFASVSKNAGHLEAVASLISTVGYGSTVWLEWLDGVNALSGNEALLATNDRKFIGCN